MAMEQTYQEALQILNSYLRENGMRRTQERAQVLHAAYMQPSYFTAEQLYQVMDKTFHVSQATIYGVLDLFAMLGLVVRHTFGKVMCYEKCLGERHFFYQVCKRCGKVTRLSSVQLQNALGAMHFPRFRPSQISMCAYGLCASCSALLTRSQKAYQKHKREQEALRQAGMLPEKREPYANPTPQTLKKKSTRKNIKQ